jgi:ribose-phosphate pyrophosphokinase
VLTLSYNLLTIPLKQWKFPSGESGIKIEPYTGVTSRDLGQGHPATIGLYWESDSDLILLGQLVDAVRHQWKPSNLRLVMKYFPYSRQDRRCHNGEGHSLKMVAKWINSLSFDKVVTWDAHSSVLDACVDNLEERKQWQCAMTLPRYDVLIAPDAGASKKIAAHRQVEEEFVPYLVAEKTREDGTVKLKLPAFDFVGKRACVVDDLCDGGATFLAVAEALKGIDGPKQLDLYVTHGLFTKGLDALKNVYDTIYTANLMNPALKGQVKEIL